MKKEATSDFNFPGRHVTQKDDGTIILDQHDFIGKITKIYVPAARRRAPDAKATSDELTAFRSLVAQLAWPARGTMPSLCFAVNDLQQRTADLKIADIVHANNVLNFAQKLTKDPAGYLIFKPLGPKTAPELFTFSTTPRSATSPEAAPSSAT